MGLIKFVFGSDNHGDMGCPIAIKKFLDFTENEWKPKYRIHGGDGMDLRRYRKGASEDETKDRVKPDIAAHLLFLEQYRPHVFLEGNHDWRLREVAEHGDPHSDSTDRAIELQDGLDEFYRKMKIQVVRFGWEHGGQEWRAPEGGPAFAHGTRHGVHAAKQMTDDYEGAVIFGDVHRVSVWQGRRGLTMSSPCLADTTKLRYDVKNPGKRLHRKGWLYGVINDKTGRHEVWPVKCEDGAWISPMGEL